MSGADTISVSRGWIDLLRRIGEQAGVDEIVAEVDGVLPRRLTLREAWQISGNFQTMSDRLARACELAGIGPDKRVED